MLYAKGHLERLTRPACLAVLIVFALFSSARARAQSTQATSSANTNQTSGDELDTIEHIVTAAYKLVSGPPGSRDWDKFRSLSLSDARFITSRCDSSGTTTVEVFTTEQFIRRAQAIFDKQGFYETPIANRIEVWDRIAHVWSTYESRRSPAEKPYIRGINSIQLLNDGTRWWIVTISWENEDAFHQMPDKYLK